MAVRVITGVVGAPGAWLLDSNLLAQGTRALPLSCCSPSERQASEGLTSVQIQHQDGYCWKVVALTGERWGARLRSRAHDHPVILRNDSTDSGPVRRQPACYDARLIAGTYSPARRPSIRQLRRYEELRRCLSSLEPFRSGFATATVVDPESDGASAAAVARAFPWTVVLERFFLYWENDDLCKRLGELGWNTIYVPEAEVVHAGGRSCVHGYRASLAAFHTSALKPSRKHARWPARWVGRLLYLALQARLKVLLYVHRDRLGTAQLPPRERSSRV